MCHFRRTRSQTTDDDETGIGANSGTNPPPIVTSTSDTAVDGTDYSLIPVQHPENMNAVLTQFNTMGENFNHQFTTMNENFNQQLSTQYTVIQSLLETIKSD